MQKDFHYDVVFALAREAGYNDNDCNIISYSSQYVDDNINREYTVEDSAGTFYVTFPERITDSGNLFLPIITQAADLTSYKIDIQRYVIAPFHFVPGDGSVLLGGKPNRLCTTRGCPAASDILKSAVKSKDNYFIGVALHAYADTWSHERFSAFQEDWNRVSKNSLAPNIGHAQVIHKPDVISDPWVDTRFSKEKIDNRERALLAAENIFGFLRKGRSNWNDVKTKFENIVSQKDSKGRISFIRGEYPEIEEYKEDRWLSEALEFVRDLSEVPLHDDAMGNPVPTRARGYDLKIKKSDAHWFRFQSAAKKYRSAVLSNCDLL